MEKNIRQRRGKLKPILSNQTIKRRWWMGWTRCNLVVAAGAKQSSKAVSTPPSLRAKHTQSISMRLLLSFQNFVVVKSSCPSRHEMLPKSKLLNTFFSTRFFTLWNFYNQWESCFDVIIGIYGCFQCVTVCAAWKMTRNFEDLSHPNLSSLSWSSCFPGSISSAASFLFIQVGFFYEGSQLMNSRKMLR